MSEADEKLKGQIKEALRQERKRIFNWGLEYCDHLHKGNPLRKECEESWAELHQNKDWGCLPVQPVQLEVLTVREIMDIGLNTPMTTGLFWAYVGERIAEAVVAKNSKKQLYRRKE